MAAIGLAAAGWSIWTPPPGDRLDTLSLTYGEALQIVTFGTSLTSEPAWPDLLANELETCLEHPVSVTRIAAPGMGSTWALTQLEQVIAVQPDLVLIEFAINDADLRDGVSRRSSLAQHRDIIQSLNRALPDTELVLMTMSPAQGLRSLIRPFLASYYADQAKIAESENIALLDLYGRWLDLPAPERKAPDGLHPSNAQTAALIVPALVETLGRAAGSHCLNITDFPKDPNPSNL